VTGFDTLAPERRFLKKFNNNHYFCNAILKKNQGLVDGLGSALVVVDYIQSFTEGNYTENFSVACAGILSALRNHVTLFDVTVHWQRVFFCCGSVIGMRHLMKCCTEQQTLTWAPFGC